MPLRLAFTGVLDMMSLLPSFGGRLGGLGAHRLGPCQHGLDDVVISGATANVTLQPFAHGLLVQVLVGLGQIDGTHDHAGCAIAALKPMMLAERRLHRVERAVGRRETFDGGDCGTLGLYCQHGAALDRAAIDMDDAGAALAGVAADMGSRQSKMLAQQLHQQRASLDLARHGLAVDLQGNGWHWSLSLSCRLDVSAVCRMAACSTALCNRQHLSDTGYESRRGRSSHPGGIHDKFTEIKMLHCVRWCFR